MSADTELLRRYVEERSEAAFAELVRLHLDLVYFAALRQVGGDAHRAQDVAQAVFTDLARKARTLTGRATLTGWLHTSTRFAAAKARRADFTRQHHEQEATTMNALLSDSDPAAEWELLRPMIDDAIHELDERDHEAVLLRFFENRPFAEIGATLRLSEDAVRMRVDRALDKLRTVLARRGVKSTGAALAVAFANQVSATAPAGLAASIAGAAFASAGTAAGTGFLMSTTTAILGAVALVAIGLTAYQWNHAFRAESELAALTVDRDGLRADLRAAQQRADRSAKDMTTLQRELDALKPQQAARSASPAAQSSEITAGQMRRSAVNKTILNQLRQIAAARDQFQIENGHSPASLDELVGEDKMIGKLIPADGENYAAVSMDSGQPLTVTTTDGTSVSYDPPPVDFAQRGAAYARLKEIEKQIGPKIMAAIVNYRASHNGSDPQTPQELVSYFATPQEGADYVEYLAAQKALNK